MANLADKFRKMNQAGGKLNYTLKPAAKPTAGDSLGKVVGGKPNTHSKGNRPASKPAAGTGKLSNSGGRL